MSHRAISALIDRIAALRTACDRRAQMLDAIVSDGACSRPMAVWALDTAIARYHADALSRLAERSDLAGADVVVMLAESVATAPLRAIVLPLLRGARSVVVRSPRGQRQFARHVVDLLAGLSGMGTVEHASDCDPREFLRDVATRRASTVIAYGCDDTVDAIARALPPTVQFEAHAHGVGVSLVLAEAADQPESAPAVAFDVAHFDQRGCLSPQTVFVEGNASAPFATMLADQLEYVGRVLPRGPIDHAEGARVVQWQGAMAARGLRLVRGASYSVATADEAAMFPSPGARNIVVAPLPSLGDLPTVLAPIATHLTCIGAAGALARVTPVIACFAPDARVVAAGSMQDPPLDGPEDRRRPRVTLTRR